MKKLLIILGLVLILSSFVSAYFQEDFNTLTNWTTNLGTWSIDGGRAEYTGVRGGNMYKSDTTELFSNSEDWEIEIYHDSYYYNSITVLDETTPSAPNSPGEFLINFYTFDVDTSIDIRYTTSGGSCDIPTTISSAPKYHKIRYSYINDTLYFYQSTTGTSNYLYIGSCANIQGGIAGIDNSFSNVIWYNDNNNNDDSNNNWIDYFYYTSLDLIKFEFNAKNNYTNNAITNFNLNLTNSSGTYSLSTTNGSIYSYQDGNIDAVFYSSEHHAKTYTSWDSTSDLEGEIGETNILLSIQDTLGNYIEGFEWNITDLTNTTNVLFETTGNISSSPPSTTVTYEVLDNQSAFYPVNHSITFPSLATGEYNLTVEYKPIVLKFIGGGTLTPIDNATITIHYPFSNAQNFTTNESGHIEFGIINGANLDLGNYTFTFQDYIGYISPVNFSRVINNTNLPYEETIEVTEAGINVKVYDRETRELLTKTTQVYVLGVLDRETDTGIVNINSTLINGDYTIQAISDGYSIEQVTFTYTGQSDVDINLYLLNITGENTALLFINARDPYARQVKGASLELTEYNVNELGFTTVSECLSNSNGECSFYIELDTKTYVVQGTATINNVFYLGSTLEAGEIFSVENEVRDLFLIPITTIDKIALDGLIISYTSQEKSFTNATNTSQVNVTFNTNNQLPLKVCLEYFQKSYLSWVSVNTQCLTTSAGQIIGDSLVLDRTSNYKAEIYIENGGNTLIYTYYYNSVNSLEYYLTVKYPLGRYLILFFWIGWLALGLYMKNVPIIAFGHIVLTWILIPLFPNTLYITGAIISTILNYQIIRTAIKKND